MWHLKLFLFFYFSHIVAHTRTSILQILWSLLFRLPSIYILQFYDRQFKTKNPYLVLKFRRFFSFHFFFVSYRYIYNVFIYNFSSVCFCFNITQTHTHKQNDFHTQKNTHTQKQKSHIPEADSKKKIYTTNCSCCCRGFLKKVDSTFLVFEVKIVISDFFSNKK